MECRLQPFHHEKLEVGTNLTDIEQLAQFVTNNKPLMVLSGAGCSTESGIFDYRDEQGNWKLDPPQNYSRFLKSEGSRRQYWSRSMLGWPRFSSAQPNAAHKSLVALENAGIVNYLVTQNVDDLHQRAGQRHITPLHGLLKNVVCLDCGRFYERELIQEHLLDWNSEFIGNARSFAPDGEAVLDRPVDYRFRVPYCDSCGGIVKPDVVFFGESVPENRVKTTYAALEKSRGLLLVGTSAMVFSSYRICTRAFDLGMPVAAINRGDTRIDDALSIHLRQNVGEVLPILCTYA